MDSLENTYLEITADGYRYLIPLSWVKEIREYDNWEENLPVLDWGQLTKGRALRQHSRYGVLLSCEGKGLGVAADEVTGVREISREKLLELKEPVRNDQNRFISAAVDLEDERQLAYILNMAVLAEYVSIISKQSGWGKDD